jgi:DNA-binding transcriptional LysR family regulator
MDVDTRVLRYFVAVAEHLSFTQAAKSLFVSQPSLSRQIRQLEDRLGTQLFVRTRTEVRLTRTGEVLLAAARHHLAEWEQTTRHVRTTAAAADNILRVGFVATGSGWLSRRARTAFLARHPHATVEPKRFDRGGEADAVRQGLVDVAFLWLPADTTGLHTAVVSEEPHMVAMSASHRLAARSSLTAADLRDESILCTRKAPAAWVGWAMNAGSTPVWRPESDNVDEMLEQAAATGAICTGPASMASHHSHPDLTWRPVTDLGPLRIAVAWARTTANPLVPPFVQTVRALTKA